MAPADNSSDAKMTPEESGRKGGEATSKSHDSKFYEDIRSEGGKSDGGDSKDDGGEFKKGSERASVEGEKGGHASGGHR